MFLTLIQYLFLLSTYPVARYILPHIKNYQQALIFHLTVGFSACVLLFPKRIFYVLLNVSFSYFILDSNPYSVLLVAFLVNMLFHLNQLLFPGSPKVTNLTTIIFLKVISTSFNIEDARRSKMKDDKLTEREKIYQLNQKPSFFEWCAYCFTPFGAISTPIYEFRLFRHLLNLGLHPERVTEQSRQRAINSIKRSFIHGSIYFMFRHLLSIRFYQSDFFNSCPLFLRIIFYLFLSIIFLSKHFMMWGAVESGYHQAGIGDAENIVNSDFSNETMIHLLTRTNISAWRQSWDHNFQMFWSYYIKSRIIKIGLGNTLEQIIFIFGKPLYKGFYGGSILGGVEVTIYAKIGKMAESIFRKYTTSFIPGMIIAQSLMLANKSSVRFKTLYSFFLVNYKVDFFFWIFSLAVFLYYHFVFKKHVQQEKVKQD